MCGITTFAALKKIKFRSSGSALRAMGARAVKVSDPEYLDFPPAPAFKRSVDLKRPLKVLRNRDRGVQFSVKEAEEKVLPIHKNIRGQTV